MKKMRLAAEAALFVAVSLPFALLPARIAVRAGEALGMLLYRLLPRRRDIAVDNIRQSLPHLGAAAAGGASPETIAQRMFVNFGRSLAENFLLLYGRGKGLIDSVEIRGLEHYDAAKARGKGVFFITGHCGNWELMAVAFGVQHEPICVLARALDNPYINGFVEKMRTRYGNRVIYKKGALREMLPVFRGNGTIGILIDQGVSRDDGHLVPFLGRTAWTTKAPALMARKGKMALVPAFIHREGDRHVLTIHPEVPPGEGSSEEDPARDTARLSRYVEDYVRRHPEEWFWVHRRWKRAGEAVDPAAD